MGNIKIIKGVFDTKLELEHAEVAAGFPINIDYSHETLDFNRDYIKHPEASFYGDVEGDSMIDAGIFDGDRVIIDRAVQPRDGSIVVAWWGGEGFTMKYLDLTHKDDGSRFLPSAKRIFGEYFETFQIHHSDGDEHESLRHDVLRAFVRDHGLTATMYQDYGWPAKELK